MRTYLDQIPRELQERPQWVGFKIGQGDKPEKTPYIADAPHRKALSTARSTWRPFSVAAAGLSAGKFDAIAYALNGDYVGVDIDDCLDDGKMTARAAEIVSRCVSYAETSISGAGIHILMAGALLGEKGRKFNDIEIYGQKRFFIITGNRLPNAPAEIKANPDAINSLLKEFVKYTLEAISLSFSAVSITSSVDDVIRLTLPMRPGERNDRLFDLARGLRFNAGMAECPLLGLKPIVRRWHDAALSVIETKEFSETWCDFLRAWERARWPLGKDLLSIAWEQSKIDPPPPAAAGYDAEPTRQLVCLCAALARLSPNQIFFLSTYAAARLVNTMPMKAFRLLKMFVADGIIEVAQTGNEFKATRYRWTAPLGEKNP